MPNEGLSAYLVEVEPSGHPLEPGSLASRARRSADDVRFPRSIYVPEDDRWFLLYEGESADAVAAAARRAVVVAIARAHGRELTDVGKGSPTSSVDVKGGETRVREGEGP